MAVKFIPSGRGKAQCPPDPNYPNGIEFKLDVPGGTPCCTFHLPYPAPECGFFKVECERCGASVALTAAGRADDPASITIPCLKEEGSGDEAK